MQDKYKEENVLRFEKLDRTAEEFKQKFISDLKKAAKKSKVINLRFD